MQNRGPFFSSQRQQQLAQLASRAAREVLRAANAQERRAVDHALIFKLSVLAEKDSEHVHTLAPQLSHLKAGVADGGVANVALRHTAALAACRTI